MMLRGTWTAILGLAVSSGFVLYEPQADRSRTDVHAVAGTSELNPSETDRSWNGIDARLVELERSLRRARFEEVLRGSDALRRRLARKPSQPGRAEREARLAVIEATAWLALDREPEALGALDRALDIAGHLDLDPARHPRKLIRLWSRAEQEDAAKRMHTVESSSLHGDRDRAPHMLSASSPRTPATEHASLRPTITCRILIDASGRVVYAKIHRSRPQFAAFEEEALRAIRASRFEPALRAGEPVSVWVNWPVHFER